MQDKMCVGETCKYLTGVTREGSSEEGPSELTPEKVIYMEWVGKGPKGTAHGKTQTKML